MYGVHSSSSHVLKVKDSVSAVNPSPALGSEGRVVHPDWPGSGRWLGRKPGGVGVLGLMPLGPRPRLLPMLMIAACTLDHELTPLQMERGSCLPVAEACDGEDNDCDGAVDEGLPVAVWYEDKDGDGFGDAGAPLEDCAQPDGSSPRPDDCADQDAERVLCSSCEEILRQGWSTGDGEYTIETDICGAHTVWCDMSADGGGWTEVVNLAFDQDPCPGEWQKTKVDFGLGAVCWRDARSHGELIRSASFSTCGVRYDEVMGEAVMYQYGTTDAFGDHPSPDINSTYGDLVSLTVDGSARTHLFTYVFGLRSGGGDDSNCPDIGGRVPPGFVGDSYLCATGNPDSGSFSVMWYETPLFAAQRFQETLRSSSVSDIEVRLMATHPNNDEDVAVESIHLLVR